VLISDATYPSSTELLSAVQLIRLQVLVASLG